MEEQGFERSTTGFWREEPPRIGRRLRVGTPVRWRLPGAEGALSRQHRLAYPAQEREVHEAILHDLSVSGARLFAPLDAGITDAALLQLQLRTEWCGVQVAWIGPSPAPSAQWCGVTFVHPSQAFMAEVFEAMDAAAAT